jgi:hypothetical protein
MPLWPEGGGSGAEVAAAAEGTCGAGCCGLGGGDSLAESSNWNDFVHRGHLILLRLAGIFARSISLLYLQCGQTMVIGFMIPPLTMKFKRIT